MANSDKLKAGKKKEGSKDLKISRGQGGIFKKGGAWHQIYDDSGHMNEWYRKQILRGVNVPTAKASPKSKSKAA